MRGGYTRLNQITGMLIISVVAVLFYQLVILRDTDTISHRAVQAYTQLQLFPQTLPVLPDNLVYEIWSESELLSTFKNTESGLVGVNGTEINDSFVQIPATVTNIEEFRLFFRKENKPDNRILFLEGGIVSDRSILSFVDIDSFKEASGSFMLGTPTDGNDLVNERSGLWFGNIVSGNSQLNLPFPPKNWVYEGWAVVDGKTITTGKFHLNDQPDNFSGFSSTNAPSPRFPGEDFLQDPPVAVFPDLYFPVDLARQQVMITLEPVLDGEDPTGAGPFAAELTRTNISRFIEPRSSQLLIISTENFPKMTIVLR